MASLDVEWLGVFIEVHRLRSVSLAAERLGLSQARASGVLAKLRRHFGDLLFVRTQSGMAPTPLADRLHPDIERAFTRLASPIRDRAEFDPATARRTFRICMTDISEIVVLPRLINELQRMAPGVGVEAERVSSGSALRLESGELDIAVGYMPSLEAGFYQQTLFRQGFVCLAARRHPRVHGKLTRQAFRREGHVVVTTSGTGHDIVEREYRRRGLQREVPLRVPSFLGIARLVAETELLATVPQLLAESFATQEAINILATPVPLPTYAVKLHWHLRFHADPGNAWLRQRVARLLTH